MSHSIAFTRSSGFGYPTQYTSQDEQAARDARVRLFNQPAVQELLRRHELNPAQALVHTYFVQGRNSRDIVVYFQDGPYQEPIPFAIPENTELHPLVKDALIAPAATPMPRPPATPEPLPTPRRTAPISTPPPPRRESEIASLIAALRQQQKELLHSMEKQTEFFRATMREVNAQRHTEMRESMRQNAFLQSQIASLLRAQRAQQTTPLRDRDFRDAPLRDPWRGRGFRAERLDPLPVPPRRRPRRDPPGGGFGALGLAGPGQGAAGRERRRERPPRPGEIVVEDEEKDAGRGLGPPPPPPRSQLYGGFVLD